MFKITRPIELFVFVLAVSTSGCGTMQSYEGPKRAPDEIAVIKSNIYQSFTTTAYVGEIDGTDLSSVQDKAEVLPGEHAVKIYVTRGLGGQQYISSKTLKLKAQAGHTYRVNGTIRDGDAYAWITDEKGGYIVSGEEPE